MGYDIKSAVRHAARINLFVKEDEEGLWVEWTDAGGRRHRWDVEVATVRPPYENNADAVIHVAVYHQMEILGRPCKNPTAAPRLLLDGHYLRADVRPTALTIGMARAVEALEDKFRRLLAD